MSEGKGDEGATDGRDNEPEEDASLRSPRSPRFQNPDTFGRSPEMHVTLEKLMEAQNAFQNMLLAHEVATDDKFKFEPKNEENNATEAITLEAQIEKKVRETMHRAFWDLLRENFHKSPPDYSQAVSLIGEVKEYLLQLVPERQERMRTDVNEVLDLDLVRQKIEHDSFDINYYANYVINRMSLICAPVRDDAVKALNEIKDPVELFQQLFKVLELMMMDMANFSISQIRPYIKQQAVSYERTKFEQLLSAQAEAGLDGLSRTRLWFKSNRQSGDSHRQLVHRALIALVDWRRPYPISDEFPETILMDEAKLKQIGNELRRLHYLCTSIFIAQGVFGPRVAHNPDYKNRLKVTLMVLLQTVTKPGEFDSRKDNIGEQIIKDTERCLGEVTTEKERKLLFAQLSDMDSHQVATLLHSRLITFLEESLLTANQSIRIPPGYSVVHTELTQCAGAFLSLVVHHLAVFGTIYDSVISDL